MTTQVIFHELETELDFDKTEFTVFACDMVAREYDNVSNISVLCATIKDAEAVDETLWQLPVDKFIPHNLFNEGDGKPSPVEILILKEGNMSKQVRNKACVINFSQELPPNIRMFHHIHEFVPVDDESKAAARKRYSEYKRNGCQLRFVKSSDDENTVYSQ